MTWSGSGWTTRGLLAAQNAGAFITPVDLSRERIILRYDPRLGIDHPWMHYGSRFSSAECEPVVFAGCEACTSDDDDCAECDGYGALITSWRPESAPW